MRHFAGGISSIEIISWSLACLCIASIITIQRKGSQQREDFKNLPGQTGRRFQRMHDWQYFQRLIAWGIAALSFLGIFFGAIFNAFG
jgi:hypothetical protein